MRISTLLAATLATLGVLAANAGAATRSWSTPTTLTPNANGGGGAQLSLAENGDTVVLWSIGYGVRGAVRGAEVRPLIEEAHFVVQASIRPDGGAYGPDQTLSNPDANAYSDGVATAADGEAIAVWTQDQVGEATQGEKAEIEYAIRPAGAAAFGAPTVLTEANVPGAEASIAMNPSGEAVIAWAAAGDAEIQYVTRSAARVFSPITTVKAASGVEFDGVLAAIDAQGDAVMSWNADAEPAPKTHTGEIEAIQRAHGGSFGAPVDVSGTGMRDYSPRPAIDGTGNATLVWFDDEEDLETKKQRYEVQARTLSSAGSLGETQTLSTFAELPEEPTIAADAAGEVTAFWTHEVSSVVAAEAAILPTAGGKFEPAIVLDSSAGLFSSDAVAVNESGATMALWAHVDSSEPEPRNEQLVEAARTPGTGFASAVAVSGIGREFVGPSLALDTAGDAAASWFAFGESGLSVQTSNFVVPATPLTKEAPAGDGSTKTSTPPPSTPFTISLKITKPSLAKLRKGTPIKVTCTLTAPGTCSVRLLISAAAARKLGFHVAKHAKTVTIGTVTISLSAAGAKTATVKLGSAARRIIKHDRRPLSLQVAATAASSSSGRIASLRPFTLAIH